MPANLTPEYRAAEEAFRKARDPQERLERLREMLRTIPKHKGTDHLQGDIKRRIKEMSEDTSPAVTTCRRHLNESIGRSRTRTRGCGAPPGYRAGSSTTPSSARNSSAPATRSSRLSRYVEIRIRAGAPDRRYTRGRPDRFSATSRRP